MSAATVARAIELDDDAPDDVCPGCRGDITGWRRHPQHYPTRNGQRVPFTGHAQPRPGPRTPPWQRVTCVWDRDYLLARQFRRQLIRGERT